MNEGEWKWMGVNVANGINEDDDSGRHRSSFKVEKCSGSGELRKGR